MLRWLAYAAVGLGLFVIAIVVLGYLLPVSHVASLETKGSRPHRLMSCKSKRYRELTRSGCGSGEWLTKHRLVARSGLTNGSFHGAHVCS